MRVLVVYCHPVETSFAAALHGAVLDALAAEGHEAVDLDLYAEGFAPALSRQERIDYRDTTRNHLAVQTYVDQLRSVEGVVLVFPTWWFGMPAPLKGYFDRVWIPGVAFDISASGGTTIERLRHIKHLAVITTYGSPWWLIRLYMRDPIRTLFKRGLGRLCGRDCKKRFYALYDMDRATPAKRAAFLERVGAGMKRF
jgi:NAD(P)H dehydrogenase (quinone)